MFSFNLRRVSGFAEFYLGHSFEASCFECLGCAFEVLLRFEALVGGFSLVGFKVAACF